MAACLVFQQQLNFSSDFSALWKKGILKKTPKPQKTFHKYRQTLQNGKAVCVDVRQDIHRVILQCNGYLTPVSWNQMISLHNAEAASCHVIQNAFIKGKKPNKIDFYILTKIGPVESQCSSTCSTLRWAALGYMVPGLQCTVPFTRAESIIFYHVYRQQKFCVLVHYAATALINVVACTHLQSGIRRNHRWTLHASRQRLQDCLRYQGQAYPRLT